MRFLSDDAGKGKGKGKGKGSTEAFQIPRGRAAWMQALLEAFPAEKKGLERYRADMVAFAKVGLVYQIWRSFVPGSWLSENLFSVMAKKMTTFSQVSAAERLDKITTNRRLRALLSYISLGCCGLPPTEIQYGLVTGLHTHFAEGGYYPEHGAGHVAAAMVRQIEKYGGRVILRSTVDRVLVDDDGKAAGVQLLSKRTHGVRVMAPVVISTIGIHLTVDKLLRPPTYNDDFRDPLQSPGDTVREDLSAKLGTLERTLGHIYVFVGIDGDGDRLGLPATNTWEFPDLDLTKGRKAFLEDPEAPFGYVGLAFPSQKDPTHAARHPGKSTAVLLAGDVPWSWFQEWEDTRVHNRGDEYEAFKARFQKRLLDVMYRIYPQLKGKVAYVNVGTPLDTNFYLGKVHGSSYGLKLNVAKAKADVDWIRPAMKGLPENMFIAGQDLTCDGFAPAVLSGLMCAAAVEGPLHWLEVVPMFGGYSETLQKVVFKTSRT